jgi:hypothetical protein
MKNKFHRMPWIFSCSVRRIFSFPNSKNLRPKPGIFRRNVGKFNSTIVNYFSGIPALGGTI